MAINLGSTAIAGAYVGTTSVSKIYLGSTEVWSGSTPPTPTGTQYGKVYYYSDFVISYGVELTENCTIDYFDNYTLSSFLAGQTDDGEIDFYYDEGENMWVFAVSGEMIAPEDMSSTTGIYVNVDDPDMGYASFSMERNIYVNTSSTIESVDLSDNSEFEAMVETKNVYSISGLYIPRSAITSFEFGTLNTTTPETFLGIAENLSTIDFTHADSLTSIGDAFLENCQLVNCAMIIPSSVTSIGGGFLAGCTNFNSAITLQSGLLSISPHFLAGCITFNQNLALPSTLTSIGGGFLMNCEEMTSTVNVGSLSSTIAESSIESFATNNEYAPCYTTGISIATATIGTITGWLDRFPNRSSSPYRKLIMSLPM